MTYFKGEFFLLTGVIACARLGFVESLAAFPPHNALPVLEDDATSKTGFCVFRSCKPLQVVVLEKSETYTWLVSEGFLSFILIWIRVEVVSLTWNLVALLQKNSWGKWNEDGETDDALPDAGLCHCLGRVLQNPRSGQDSVFPCWVLLRTFRMWSFQSFRLWSFDARTLSCNVLCCTCGCLCCSAQVNAHS